MLDRMRRRRNLLKWSLGVVVVTFVAIYFPNFVPTGEGTSPTDAVATVAGRKVLVGTYQREYQMQLDQIRRAYGEQFNEQMLQQLQIPMQVLQQLVNEETIQAEADRLGIRASDEEVRQMLLAMPELQDNGQFVGEDRYRQALSRARPPITPAEFEEDLRRRIRANKLQALATSWVQVDDAEVEQEFKKRNEKVKLELAVFKDTQFRSAVQPTEAELKAQFDKDPEKYRLPEKRRVRFLAVDSNSLKAQQTATMDEVRARYEQNSAAYSTPEQVRASHILLKTEGKDVETVKKAAEDVLKKVKAGGDFAALAKQYSEDGSKDKGGDLDFFPRERMVKPFSDAAFSMKVGQVSDLVQSEFGFHIIKVTDRKAATTKTVEDVRAQIEDQIKSEKARAAATTKADQIAGRITTPADLESVAKAEGLALSDSGLFSRDEPLAGLGFAPAVAQKAFEMELNKVSEKLQTPMGFAWITLAEIKPSALPTLDAVKDQVRDDVVRVKAIEVAKARAATMAKAAQSGSFAAAAKAAGVEVKTTELIARGAPLPEVGVNQAVEDVVFGLKPGATSEPITTADTVVVVRVKERQDPKPEDLATGRAALRDELRQQRQGQFFSAYMVKVRDKLPTTFNQSAIEMLMKPR